MFADNYAFYLFNRKLVVTPLSSNNFSFLYFQKISVSSSFFSSLPSPPVFSSFPPPSPPPLLGGWEAIAEVWSTGIRIRRMDLKCIHHNGHFCDLWLLLVTWKWEAVLSLKCLRVLRSTSLPANLQGKAMLFSHLLRKVSHPCPLSS